MFCPLFMACPLLAGFTVLPVKLKRSLKNKEAIPSNSENFSRIPRITLWTALHYRNLEANKISGLENPKGNYESYVKVSHESK